MNKRATLLAGCLLASFSIGTAVLWHKVVRHQVIPRNFGIVEPGEVYRSGQLSARMLEQVVDKYNIKTVIALNKSDEPIAREREWLQDQGIAFYALGLRGDGTGKPDVYGQVLAVMTNKDNHPILIHCAAGAQRTSGVVILYRHLYQDMPFTESYPESFDFKHKPDEWKLLAYLADNIGSIKRAYETHRNPK